MSEIELQVRHRVIPGFTGTITLPTPRTLRDIASSILRNNPDIRSAQLSREDMDGNRCRDGDVLVFTPVVTQKYGGKVGGTVWKRKGKERSGK